MLPKEAIEEYRQIYKKVFGVDLSDEEATLRANNFFNLYKVVNSPTSFDLEQAGGKPSNSHSNDKN